jgi:LCP family protein required for cell wall assembly
VVTVVVVALLGWVGYTAYTPYHAWSTVSRVDSTPTGARGAAPAGGHVYLLVGSDSRAGLTAAQKRRLGTGSVVGQRTDSIILVYVPSGGGGSALISIPRDSYVPIPGHGRNKINAAYAFGGPKLLVETVELATDLRIDGYLEVGFGGFVSVVDGLGGVDICVPFRMNDPKAHINLKKGCQTLNGPNALGYVRARYSDPRGDIGRAERQRQFLGAIMKKVATASTVLDPVTWWHTTHDVAGALTVGQDTSLMDGERIAMTMRKVSQGDALSLVVPLADINYQTPAGSSVKWDTTRAKALFSLLREGRPLTAPPAGTDGKPSGG